MRFGEFYQKISLYRKNLEKYRCLREIIFGTEIATRETQDEPRAEAEKRHETCSRSIRRRRKFVRVLERRPDGLVAFEFAIGEPDLCVDMLLPAEAFARFCEEQQVIHLEGAAREDGLSDWDWSMRTAAQQRFR